MVGHERVIHLVVGEYGFQCDEDAQNRDGSLGPPGVAPRMAKEVMRDHELMQKGFGFRVWRIRIVVRLTAATPYRLSRESCQRSG